MSNLVISFPMFGENFTLNPSKCFTVFGRNIYWYGVIIAVGFLLAVVYMLKRRRDFGLSEDNVIDMLIFTIPIGVIGARLYYVLFNFELYKDNLSEIYKIWNGGLAIYGGVIFGALTVFFYYRSKKIPVGVGFDLCALGLLIGQAVGRWGNFINREAYGAATEIFCRMGLTDASGVTTYVHPTFLYESLWNIVGFLFLHFFSKKHRKFDGQIFIMYMGWYGLGRFWIEGLRTDSLYLFNSSVRVSQLIAALALSTAVIILFCYYLNKRDSKRELYCTIVSAAAKTTTEEMDTMQSEANEEPIEGTDETVKETDQNEENHEKNEFSKGQ